MACRPDLDFINLRIDKTAIARLEEVANKPFKRLSYTDAISHLEEAAQKGHKFDFPVSHHVELEMIGAFMPDKAVAGCLSANCPCD